MTFKRIKGIQENLRSTIDLGRRIRIQIKNLLDLLLIASLIPKRYRFLGLDLYKSLDRLLYEGLTVPVLVLPLKLVVISVVIFGHRVAQELSPGISGPVHPATGAVISLPRSALGIGSKIGALTL